MIVCICFYLCLLFLKAFLSVRYASKKSLPEEALSETITIVQPILSGDPLLEESLKHNLDVFSTNVHFLWLVDENDAEGRRVSQALSDTYQQISIVLCPDVPASINPKAYKLELALEHIQTQVFAVLDDDTLLSKASLSFAVHALHSADLVTGLPYYLPAKGFWSSLLSHFVNNNSLLTYLPLLNFAEPLSINGMFYVSTKKRLEALGGFKAVWHQLSDDFAVYTLFKQAGANIVQSPVPHAIRTTVTGLGHYAKMMHRWFLFAQFQIKQQSIGVSFSLLLLFGFPPLLLWLICLLSFKSLLSLFGLTIVILLRHLTLRFLHKHFFTDPPAFSVPTSLLAELLQPFHMLHAAFSKTITWRSRQIRVRSDGHFSYLDEHT